MKDMVFIVAMVFETEVEPYKMIKDKPKCEHCGPSRHNMETCWDLHDHPQREFQGCPQRASFTSGFHSETRVSTHSVTFSI